MPEMIISNEYKSAVELNQKIIITAQAAQQNLYDMCVMLKQMRDDKLYKELGYANFEDYCEQSIGFSRRNARNYIAIIEKIDMDGKSISRFGMTKLSLLASLSESQQEEIQQTVNLEETTVRKLKAEIEKLKQAERTAAEKAESLQEICDKNEDLKRKACKEKEELSDRLDEAHKKIQELESNVTQDRDVQEVIKNLDRMLSEADQEHANNLEIQRKKYQAEINRLNDELQEQKEKKSETMIETVTVEVPDTKEVFKAYYKNAINAFNEIIGFIRSVDDKPFFIEKTNGLVSRFDELIKNI